MNNRLFVADTNNNRVIVYDVTPGTIANGVNATYELGQASGGTQFTSHTTGNTQSTLNSPMNVAYDAANSRLFVGDWSNRRVLVFDVLPADIADGENAEAVIGQTNYTNTTNACSQTGMSNPGGLSYDANNSRLFSVDDEDARVLKFNAGPSVLPANTASATFVLGEHNIFTSCSQNISQAAMSMTGGSASQTSAVVYDPGSGRVFVADTSNNRIMIFEGSFVPASDYFNP